jgi:hypothetical protein
MATRRASCSCGQLTVEVEGDPMRVSICHCLACQRRTERVRGAVTLGPRAGPHRGRGDRVRTDLRRGRERSFFFCPRCGATVYYWIDAEHIALPVGAFADPNFPRRADRCGRSACTRGSACPRDRAHPLSSSATGRASSSQGGRAGAADSR